MKTLKFNFNHPVKGMVRLLNKINPRQKCTLPLDTESGQCAEISIDELPVGEWKAFLEWEHDGRDYFYEKEFEIS